MLSDYQIFHKVVFEATAINATHLKISREASDDFNVNCEFYNINSARREDHITYQTRLEGLAVSLYEIKRLASLVSLSINRINLTSIPTEIYDLANLEQLSLDNNKITVLPQKIVLLSKLTELRLSGNQIKEIPREILELKALKVLDLTENPLNIPPEILSKIDSPSVILREYFDPRRPILEAKVLVVGQGSVGKTSLVQRLLHNTFDPNQSKTDGISIRQWKVNSNMQTAQAHNAPYPAQNQSMIENRRAEIKLNIWDFGGQEIMHATHQFFLTKRSLYLLVLDARLTQEENRVEYWLKIIQSFGGESPVLIVGNKTDQHPFDIDRTRLTKKYSNIISISEVSAATGKGITDLRNAIAMQINILPHVYDQLSETWFTVKSRLESLSREINFFTWDNYIGLCNENNVGNDLNQRTLISFLHDLGVVLHFQDDPRLEALGILNPEWVTNGVYKILNANALFQNRGVLNLTILNEILNLSDYPRDKRLFIVDIMKKFELCYDIVADKSFLVPDLLPKEEPYTGEWDKALAFEYHYNVLPSSIISRFIVRMNAFIHKTVWRSGVVLKRKRNTALVRADMEDRKIYILVSGEENTRRDFLSAIRMEFDAIHKTIAKIEATEKVPIPDQPKAAPIEYEFLLNLERNKRITFPVHAGNKIIDVNVRELLMGIRPPENEVFISYAHQDKAFAKRLADRLENEGMRVWWDFDRLKGGQDWQKEIERAIKQCNFFLIALTPDSVTSEWVGNEITYANKSRKTIIPLHLKTCDIPIGLIKKQYIDFEKQTKKAALNQLLGLLKDKA